MAELEARRLLYTLGVRERSDKLVRELVLEDAAPFVQQLHATNRIFHGSRGTTDWRSYQLCALRAREKLLSKLPVTGELLRGSLLERTIRHTKDCPKCARGEGHRVFVLTVSYGGGRTRQFSVRRERVTEVRRLLANYQKLKQAIEGICELNHELLRPDAAASKSRRKQHD